jgi:hypothetical protein
LINSISACEPEIADKHSAHLLQPPVGQTNAAAKAIAAFDLPEPAGPVKSQACVICWPKLPLSLAASTASLRTLVTCC